MNKLTIEGRRLIMAFEQCKRVLPDGSITAYLCPAKKWTIGYGNTFYEDGTPVKMGDVISKQRAETLFSNIAEKFVRDVRSLVPAGLLNDQQFSALVSFAFNVGSDIDADDKAEGLGDSTLLKLVLKNPNDPAIRGEFVKWRNRGSRFEKGLLRRRLAEWHLYSTGALQTDGWEEDIRRIMGLPKK